MSSGKGTIPYEIINTFNSLDKVPERDFFPIDQFYQKLKGNIISEEECRSVKKFYQTMKMENLGELNKLYNFQDTIILCKIFESRANFLNKKFKYKPRKCNSASSFSRCVHRDKSTCCIAMPINSGIVKLFGKTLIGGFSCANTRLAFDSQILLPNERTNLKLICNLKINGEKKKIESSQKFQRWMKIINMAIL